MDFFDLIKEPIFLFASTILSILMSVIANLLTPKFTWYLSNFSSSLKNKQLEKKKVYISKVILASSDNNKVINIKLDAAYTLLKSLVMIVFSLFLFSISPYIYTFGLPVVFISLAFVIYAISLLNISQANYKLAVLATLRAGKMAHLRNELNEKYEQHDELHGYVDSDEEMYNDYLAKWDSENL
jgi:hypothetical protein